MSFFIDPTGMPFELAAIIGVAILIFVAWADKHQGVGESRGKGGFQYRWNEVQRKTIDKDADKYEMVEKATGKVLVSGTSDECAKWKKEHVEPMPRNPKK